VTVAICHPFKLSPPPAKGCSSIQTSINMMRNAIKTCKNVDLKEELFIDLDATIEETKLTLGTLIQIKQTILDNSKIISDTFCSSLSQFTIEPTFPFPQFIH
jgi:hypothetical protein